MTEIRNALQRASDDAGNSVSIECVGQIIASFLTFLSDEMDGGHIDLGDCMVWTGDWGDLAQEVEDVATSMQTELP